MSHNWLKIAAAIEAEVDKTGLSPRQKSSISTKSGDYPLIRVFDEMVTSPDLIEVSRQLFTDGHYAMAVEKAFVCLNNRVKEKSVLNDKDGADLMRMAFSANSPVLALNSFQSQSEKNEQQGYMEIFAGTMIGIRNPRVHEHTLEDEPEVALELLVLANHLMRIVDNSSLSRE